MDPTISTLSTPCWPRGALRHPKPPQARATPPGWRTRSQLSDHRRPSPQDQLAATLQLQSEGLSPDADYLDPRDDALANMARGRSVPQGEPAPDLGQWPTKELFSVPQTPQQQRVANDRALLQDPRVAAYLDTIAYTEGFGDGVPLEYNSYFGDHPNSRRKTFTDDSHHPGSGGVPLHGSHPTAAGRYQINGDTYNEFSRKLGLSDFTPETQDLMAVQMLRESGAIDGLLSGDLPTTVNRSGRWISMPALVGGQWQRRRQDQPSVPFDKIQQYYRNRLRFGLGQ